MTDVKTFAVLILALAAVGLLAVPPGQRSTLVPIFERFGDDTTPGQPESA